MKNIYKLLLALTNMKKRMLFMFGFLLAVYLIGLTSAADCPYIPNQTILTLYSDTNTHASVFNNTFSVPQYTVKINYNDIFGVNYMASCNPYNCTGTNNVLSLYTPSNSHVQIGPLGPAPFLIQPVPGAFNICYGNLRCVTSTTPCDSSTREVVAISSLNNGHIARNALLSGYPNRICCASTVVTPPGEINITSPEHRQIYYQNTLLDFRETDPGGILTYNWTVWNSYGSLDFTDNRKTFQHTFTTTGTKVIQLTVFNNTYRASKEVAILIVAADGAGAFAYINQPKYQELVNTGGTGNVSYSANESYVVDSNVDPNGGGVCRRVGGNSCTTNNCVECLAGNCPMETKNSPMDCITAASTRKIEVYNEPQPYRDYTNFNWNFSNTGNPGRIFDSRSAFRNLGAVGSIIFQQSGNNKLISLLINYTDAGISISQTAWRFFDISPFSNVPDIVDAAWEDTSGAPKTEANIAEPGTPVVLAGYFVNVGEDVPVRVEIYDADRPAALELDSFETNTVSVDGNIKIKPQRTLNKFFSQGSRGYASNPANPGQPLIGNNYTFKIQFVNPPANADNTPERSEKLKITNVVPPGGCRRYDNNEVDCGSAEIQEISGWTMITNCRKDREVKRCIYNRVSGECKDGWVFYDSANQPVGTCIYELINQGDCIDGYRTLDVTSSAQCANVNGNGPASCTVCDNGTCRIPCGRSVAALAFFGVMQLVIALIAIAIIYYAISRARKKRRK